MEGRLIRDLVPRASYPVRARRRLGTGIEREAWTERRVERIGQVVVEVVVTEARAQVHRPTTSRAAPSARSGVVRHVGGEFR